MIPHPEARGQLFYNATPELSRSSSSTAPEGELMKAPKTSVMVTKSNFGPTVFPRPRSQPATCVFPASPKTPESPAGKSESAAAGRERTFACDYPNCNKTYLKSSHLKAHYRVHTGKIFRRNF